MKNFKCWLIGHAIDPCDCYAGECYRCGITFPYDAPPRSDLGFYLAYYDVRRWLRFDALRNWLKCPDCGKRFDHHRHDCMPF